MKYILLIVSVIYSILTIHPQKVQAIQATTQPVEVRLPDGTSLTIRIYGDEHFHYTTTIDGYLIKQGRDGFYYYIQSSGNRTQNTGTVRAHNPGNRSLAEQASLRLNSRATNLPAATYTTVKRSGMGQTAQSKRGNNTIPLTGSPKALIILMEYADVKFTVSNPQQTFNQMANQQGYSENGATGSIRDYFRYNSSGQFDPEFIVFGPVTLEHSRDFYEGDIMFKVIPEIFPKAMAMGLNITEFDNDGDGILDNFFIYFAGHNQAESGEANTIWPHRSSMHNLNITYNGILLGDYACTSELKGSSTSNQLCGIGTFCHEFSHVLGLPDVYDLNSSTDGATAGLFSFSLMSNGNYNNEGRTPPSMNAVERNMLGWLELEELNAGIKNYELPPISENKAYMFSTENEGEFFVLENRNANNPWDRHINSSDQGTGLLIYHVDRSENMVNGRTAKERWEYSGINNVLAHPCFRLIPASGKKNYEQGDPGNNMFFPGNKNVTQLNFVPWSGEVLENRLERIRLENDIIHFSYYATTTLAEQVTLSSRSATVEILHSLQLEATLLPEDVSNPAIIWSSSNDSIARVNDKGLVTGTQAGTATITARSADGNAQASCVVTVHAGNLEENQKFDIGQREIRIAWPEPETPQIWVIKWKKQKNQNFQTLESDTTLFIINQLEPDTEYEVEITAIINDNETAPLIKQTLRTRPLEGQFPVIHGIRADWTEGDRFWPVVNNIPGEVRRITWKLDDKPFPVSSDLILPAGEHKLQAEITTGDGTTETIIRQITVKPKQK